MSLTQKTSTLMQRQFSLPKKILYTILIMTALILLVYYFRIPNPNMILIAGLVFCSALFGFGGGLIGAAIMLGYSMYFFSTDHSFFSYTPENLQKVMISLTGIALDVLLVCNLKAAEIEAFDQVKNLTRKLNEENQKLQHISHIDALTGIRNRMALREDIPSYLGHSLTVMMLDLNEFKGINDTYGHEEGDRILRETGTLLKEAFGAERCYRYGGDEFLVIVPEIELTAFEQKLDHMMRQRPRTASSEEVTYAAGYVQSKPDTEDQLQELISAADEKMYQNKREVTLPASEAPEVMEPELPASEFTAGEMKDFLQSMSEKYDLARVVDPTECRILEMKEDGSVSREKSCYGIWNSGQRCLNCSSALACRTGCHQTKAEEFKDQLYIIQSSPVTLKLQDGSHYDAVVELVNIQKDQEVHGNDREAENVGFRAANYIARHDGMTNTLNADAFYAACRRKLKDAHPDEWLMITSNIMNFRLVNTLFGDMKGNELLVHNAAMLRGIAEHSDGICGRLGNDQFALLIPKRHFREELLLNMEAELAEIFNSGVYTFCIHFGIYEIEDPNTPVSVMCGRANSAMRTIREDLSRYIAYYNDAIRNKLIQEQTVISSFEEALKEEQFCMYLQPITEKDGRPVGAEALVRWLKPDGTMIMPVDFIEILEHAGLIQKLDLYMWELAVRKLQAWKNTSLQDLFISVNVSARDFYSLDVYQTLSDLVEQYGVDCRKLRLEITETALFTEPSKGDDIVSSLRKKGFTVEIDDFGTGYSSLSLLKDIHADVLKIDRSFLQEIEGNQHNSMVLHGVIQLADSLGMDVITEGVETTQQLEVLSDMGCRHFQGYLFSCPITPEAFETKYC